MLISIFIWLLMSLSKEYTISISFPVQYVNLPSDKLIANKLPETMDVEIKSTGFQLLLYKLKQNRETILIDIKGAKPLPAKNNYYINFNERLDKITGQFQNSIKIIRVLPDTLIVNYNKKITKRVPVKVNVNIKFKEQYQQVGNTLVEPEFVIISGAYDVLSKIHYVETVPMELKKVAAPVSLKLDILKYTQYKQVEYTPKTVYAKINVKKFTEGALELPIIVENLPPGFHLKIFPDKVLAKYQVAFDDYKKVNISDFKVAVDYSKIEPGSNKLKIQLLKKSSLVHSVKLNKEKVEFIIRK